MLDCCVANFGRDLWLIHVFGWSKLNDDPISSTSWIDVTTDENPIQILDCCKKCVSSGSFLYWVDNDSSIRTKQISLNSLQYLCVKSLMSGYPSMKRWNETEARQFGIPVNIWKRFVNSSPTESVETVVMLD